MNSGGETNVVVDWDLARSIGKRLVARSPSVSPFEAIEVVDQLRRFAVESAEHVSAFTGLSAPDPGPPTLVVDRQRWLDVNVDAFAVQVQPLLDKIAASRSGQIAGAVGAVGRRATAFEIGFLLSFIGSRVLGQYEPFLPSIGEGASEHGTLLLVAPNVVAAERDMRLSPADFRRWVCLHEETHRVQFTAVPWMREHVAGLVRQFLLATEVDPGVVVTWANNVARAAGDVVRGKAAFSLVDLVTNPDQRRVMDQLTALMSVLEGHAEFVMDGVGPSVVPTVAEIRTAFNARRAGRSSLDTLLRHLLGLEAKMRQYRDGERFVSAVVDRVGMAGFNEVWAAPANLPSLSELHDPAAWVARVHAAGAPVAPVAAAHDGR
ncbi:MAG TPA: zinc-dependent metalloprotease [Sporichthyaceae bacterium]|nr:zinc-dependent metalloprotease [Sporichthyaceae bacterium]